MARTKRTKESKIHLPVGRDYSLRAMRSFFGARVGGQDRPQDINTPQAMADALLVLWPEGVELDPCSNVNSLIPAEHHVIGKYNTFIENWVFISSPKYSIGVGAGLSIEWPDRTFCNPPFNNLNMWLSKGINNREHLFLVPVRTNRKWYRYHAKRATCLNLLNPIAFAGYEQMYPTPLALIYYGTRIKLFMEAFEQFGEFSKLIG